MCPRQHFGPFLGPLVVVLGVKWTDKCTSMAMWISNYDKWQNWSVRYVLDKIWDPSGPFWSSVVARGYGDQGMVHVKSMGFHEALNHDKRPNSLWDTFRTRFWTFLDQFLVPLLWSKCKEKKRQKEKQKMKKEEERTLANSIYRLAPLHVYESGQHDNPYVYCHMKNILHIIDFYENLAYVGCTICGRSQIETTMK